MVTASDIVGGVDIATGNETGLEVVRQIYPRFAMTPGILMAPRFSKDATVTAALQAKTTEINSVFRAVCIVDIDSSKETGATKYADVKVQKERQAATSANCYAVWPYAKVGDVIYSGSTLAGALTSYTDAQHQDIPNWSPSNKTLSISAACLEDGTEVILDQDQANTVNSYGVATFLNINGYRLWGNNTCCSSTPPAPALRWRCATPWCPRRRRPSSRPPKRKLTASTASMTGASLPMMSGMTGSSASGTAPPTT